MLLLPGFVAITGDTRDSRVHTNLAFQLTSQLLHHQSDQAQCFSRGYPSVNAIHLAGGKAPCKNRRASACNLKALTACTWRFA